MDHVPGIEFLFARIEARDVLTPEEKRVLTGSVDEVRLVPARKDMVREGDRPSHSTLLLSGIATRYKVTAEGARQITALHVGGDFVDLHSFPLRVMDHSVGAHTDCMIATVPHAALRRITEEQPHLTRLLWLMTLLDSAIHREWLVSMGATPAISHLAHLFCEMYLRLKVVGLASDLTFTLPMTQSELADVLGISAVHVNRVLQELRGDGILKFDGKIAAIESWDRLVDVAQFDSAHLHIGAEPR